MDNLVKIDSVFTRLLESFDSFVVFLAHSAVFNSLAILTVVFIATFATRFAPFIVFAKGNVPKKLLSLGEALPPAMIGMLIVYCFKDIDFSVAPFGLNEAMGILLVALLYVVSRLGVLCVIGGTAGYMGLVQSDVLSRIFG